MFQILILQRLKNSQLDVEYNGAISTNFDYLMTKADATTGGYKLMDDSVIIVLQLMMIPGLLMILHVLVELI